ncbi:MAG: metal ABC transporter permease [Deltaproteobacteria bacterium]|nr:metal ABC transporter permease [Deltaproteobacteria bacterium]
MNFFSALQDPANSFLRLALAVGLCSSLAFGIIGTYVVTRRISYLAGAISHCVLGGIGAALWLRHSFALEWLDPVYGALPAALLAALAVGRFGRSSGQREETLIGATWAVGMALGLIFLDFTPGYFNLSSYLFGDILLVSQADLYMILGLDLLIILFVWRFYHPLLAISFDEEFAGLRGLRVKLLYYLLLALIATTVVLMIRVVGIVMVIAMLTLPAAAAAIFTHRLYTMMLMTVIISATAVSGGLGLSYGAGLSSGPIIILLSGFIYVFAALWKKFKRSPKHG